MSAVGDARKRLAERTQPDPTAVAVRAAQAEALREADLLKPWGPFEMGGFEGCTDRNSDHCACATDQQPTCRLCDREIEPGEQAWARQWPCYDTLPLDHADQGWDVISWHDNCPDDRADRLATDTAAPEGEVGTGADEGATGQDTGTAWVTRSTDCPEAPAQAHLPAAPVAVEGVETDKVRAEVLDGDELNELVDLIAAARDKAPRLPTDADSWDVLDAITPTIHRILAARIVQARAGEGALRERVEALRADCTKTVALDALDAWDRGWRQAHRKFEHLLRAALTTADPS